MTKQTFIYLQHTNGLGKIILVSIRDKLIAILEIIWSKVIRYVRYCSNYFHVLCKLVAIVFERHERREITRTFVLIYQVVTS